jgi:hypothetical protein
MISNADARRSGKASGERGIFSAVNSGISFCSYTLLLTGCGKRSIFTANYPGWAHGVCISLKSQMERQTPRASDCTFLLQ